MVFPCAHLVYQPFTHEMFRTATPAQPPRYPSYRSCLVYGSCGHLIRGITAPIIAGECGSYLLPTPLPPVPHSYYNYMVAKIDNDGQRTHATLKNARAARDTLKSIAVNGPLIAQARDLAFAIRDQEQSL